MIQVLSIRIEEFRGIRHLDIDLNGKSFVIHGPNGSGKSGVVDAIGFAFTGGISRLSGSGTGGITVQKHGPHVHRRDDPGAARVTLTFRDGRSGQIGTITRTVKHAASYSLEPDTPELRLAVDRVQRHPELTLSRREIIRFILTESGKRAAEVQALLQLDSLDAQRNVAQVHTWQSCERQVNRRYESQHCSSCGLSPLRDSEAGTERYTAGCQQRPTHPGAHPS